MNARDRTVHFRVTEEEYGWLLDQAGERPMSEYLRGRIIELRERSRLEDLERRVTLLENQRR